MIIYIKPHSDIPFEFEHMKPVRVDLDSVEDRVNENTFKCTARYVSDGIQSIWVTAFIVGKWNYVDIAFTEDMRLVTYGSFYVESMDSEECTIIGTIKFYDMANAVETEKLTREHESMKHINCLCTTAVAHRPMVRYTEYNIGTVDKGTRSLRAITELKVEKIITNGPATIVFWNDRTKTIVKREIDDEDDLYNAVASALAKKVFGSTSKFHKTIDKKYRTNEKGW